MPQEMPEIETEELLGQAIASYLRAADAGRPLDRAEFLARHPELKDELSTFFSNFDEAELLSRPLRALSTSLPPRSGERFEDYEILGEVARGGMGVIYRARQLGLNRTVALKMIRAGRLATEEDVERFRTEAKAAASLNHPNIVPIYEYGEKDGHQYFTMELIEGHTLNRHECDFMTHPAEAARIMATIARAVHHAHQRRIIHRDLKPGNILIDSGGDPHITDFGLAMRETGGERLTDSDVLIGTLPYMSPEQLSDKVQPLTTSVDIWSLGVILYELLTRRLPFQGRTQVATLENIRKEDPVRPRTLNRQLPRDLEAICLKCLEKEPERRYGSALGLARDLERWLKREPIEARPVHRVVRAWSWCRRNPAAAGLILGSALLLIAASLGVMIRIAQKQERDRQKLEGLIHMARFASNSILNRMQEWGVRVEALAHSPELLGRLADWRRTLKDHPSADPENLRSRPEAQKLQAFLDTLPREPMIVNWQIMDVDGIMMARKPASILGVNFKERDYLQGTLRHAGQSGRAAIHISSVYRSQVDGLDKFDICAPVTDGGTVLGILAVSVTTDPTLGVPWMHGEQRKVVLIAPWDPSPPRERRPEGVTPEYVVLLHPAMTSGHEAVPFDKEMMPARFPRNCREELSVTDTFPISELSKERYLDPFGSQNPQYSGPWLAGFAPVGNTGFVVIVQQKAD